MKPLLPCSVIAISVCLAAWEARGPEGDAAESDIVFPDGFLFGTATSSFQHDMGCPSLSPVECDDPNSDWFVFTTDERMVNDPTTFVSGESPTETGPGHWELFDTDFDLARDILHNNAFRFTLEWSRIFPYPTDGAQTYADLRAIASTRALEHYHQVFDSLRRHGLTPLVTINHYSLPVWLHDTVACHEHLETCRHRGWLDADRTVREITKFASFVATEFGANVDLWATLNEPFSVVLPGYFSPSPSRANPPAVFLRPDETKAVANAMVLAHARMYDAVHAADQVDADGDGLTARVGVVYNMAPVKPADPGNPLDVRAAENVFYLWNMVYLNAVALGLFDEDFDGTAIYRDDLAGRMDYIGLNYYTPITVEGTVKPMFPRLSPLTTFNPLTVQLWEDDPRGIYDMALVIHNDLHQPVIVTENGAVDANDDGTGARCIVRHLTWLARAMDQGVRVDGYFYWTLMDDYEWNQGANVPMGLFAVDKYDPAKTRVPRQSAAVYGEIAGTGVLSAELQQAYPVDPETL